MFHKLTKILLLCQFWLSAWQRFGPVCSCKPPEVCSPKQPRQPLAQRSIDGRMPRLSPAYLNHAYNENPLLPLLLRACRDLPSARNELRWLREHVEQSARQPRLSTNAIHRLKRLCISRSKGKPLQYILGSQPFGELDIKCRPGVLIPRYPALPSTKPPAIIY